MTDHMAAVEINQPPEATAALTPLAEIKDYGDLHALLRARADELEIARTTFDDVVGLSSGYSSKALCDPPMKRFGADTIGAVLQVLGVRLFAFDDPAMIEKIRNHHSFRPRVRMNARAPLSRRALEARIRRKLAQQGAAARNARLTAEQRSESARNAARARWSRNRKKGGAA